MRSNAGTRHRRTLIRTIPQQVGKYLVCATTRSDDRGRHSATVSIRSGRGSTTHDRVVRFVPLFDSPERAARYALAQARAWIRHGGRIAHLF